MHVPFKDDGLELSCELFWYNAQPLIEDEDLKDRMLKDLEESYGSGYSAGGSGHVAHQSYEVFLIKNLQGDYSGNVLVGYHHFVESEFSTTQKTRIEVHQKSGCDEELVFRNRLLAATKNIKDDLGFE